MPNAITLFALSEANRRSQWLWRAVVTCGGLGWLLSVVQLAELSQAQFWQFACLAAIIALTGRLAVLMPNAAGTMTPSDAFIFLAAFFLGPPAATLVAGLNGFIAAGRTRRSRSERLYAASGQALATLIAAALGYGILNWSGGTALSHLSSWEIALEQLLVASLAMVALYFLVNSTLLAALQAWRRGLSIGDFWVSNHLWAALHVFASGTAATLVFVLMRNYGPVYILAIAPIVAAAFATCRIYFEKVEATTQHIEQMGRLHLATVEALATAIDAKDQTTHEHVRRVQIYAAGLARIFGLSEAEIEALRAGALLHDVGKLAVPDHILNKPGKLTPAEFEKMKIHTVVGSQILERVGFPYPVAPIVRYHHERWDGQGYPEGLQGEAIPMTARILSVVDCFDAVREDRPYRRGLTREQACKMLANGSGKQFDPQVVSAFITHLLEFERQIAESGAQLELSEIEDVKRASTEEGIAAAQAGRVSGRLDYLDQIKSAQAEVYSLYEIARTFSSSLNLEDTIAIFVNKLKHIVPFDTCVIYLYDEEAGVATVEKAVGKHAEAFDGRRVFPGEGVTGWALANRQIFCNTDPALDLGTLKLEAREFKTMAAVPLLKNDTIIGVIALYAAGIARYSDDHTRLLETIARLAADSFYNALHHAATQEIALTDPLTGLPNSRAFTLQFEQEANRANRQNTPFCILMMDLDGFKQINDTCGHQTGDAFLNEISRIIAAELRSYDFLARYAGDEFVAILPGLTEAALAELTERIVQAVETFKLPVRDGHTVSAGVSIGAARYLTEGTSLERLLRIADRRMYKNKSVRKQEFVIGAGETGAEVLSLHKPLR
jgi:diguanylate cyclase (GGDEF)-like protein/putative nucleotidyltransferase with HDIG domain